MSPGDISFLHGLYPLREGREIYVISNGERIKLSPLQASLIAQSWLDALGGAYIAGEHSPQIADNLPKVATHARSGSISTLSVVTPARLSKDDEQPKRG